MLAGAPFYLETAIFCSKSDFNSFPNSNLIEYSSNYNDFSFFAVFFNIFGGGGREFGFGSKTLKPLRELATR